MPGVVVGLPLLSMAKPPASPDAARKVTPWCPVGVTKVLSREFSVLNSFSPQLMETAETPARLAAVATAAYRSGSLAEFASTRMMLAPGATECAHSMSRASSISQLPLGLPAPAGSTPGSGLDCPDWFTFVKLGGSGTPSWTSNWARSLLENPEAVLFTKLGSS